MWLWLRAGVVAGSVQGSISVTADNVCQGIEGTMNRDYTKEVLEYRIDVSYLPLSLRELTSTVDVGRCGGRRRRDASDDVMITVTIRGSYESVLIQSAVFCRRSL